MTPLVERYRLTGRMPTLAEKVADTTDPRELDGMALQLTRDGRATDEVKALFATRRAELARGR